MEIDRTRRVGELIQRELALIINSGLSDPRIGMVTLTDVKLTRDLKQATVFVTEFSSKDEHKELINALTSASGFLKRQLSQRLDLRTTPKLEFRYDPSIENGLKISGLINQARQKDSH